MRPSIELFREPPLASLKSCCSELYHSEWARFMLGDSWHPGGLILTERLGQLLNLGPNTRVLDVAAGHGTSAIYLAERFGCRVTAIDYGARRIAASHVETLSDGSVGRVATVAGDAEVLPLKSGAFDAVICECSYCTFPNKPAAASEFARVLRPGGMLGVTDVTVSGPLPESLKTLIAWITCIADARTVTDYASQFEDVGFDITAVEDQGESLTGLIKDVRLRLVGLEVLAKLGKLGFPAETLQEAKALAQSANAAVAAGLLGYSLIIGSRS